MKVLSFLFLTLFNITLLFAQDPSVHTCGADELMHWRSENDANYFKSIQILNSLNQQSTSSSSGKTYYIPVVFHIIADTQSILDAFDSARIQAQLDTLNYHFAANDANIIFCLAQNLPTGISKAQWSEFGTIATPGLPGITYTLDTNIISFDIVTEISYYYSTLPFPAEQYLNIYVVDSVLISGVPFDGAANVGPSLQITDGIGIQYDAFVGTSLGKTLVHEVGHWLGLWHVFNEPYPICDVYPQDTATAYLSPSTSISDCVTPYTTTLSCAANPPYNQGENHMDYHIETCLNVFTGEQVLLMHKLLDDGRPFIHSDINLINTGVRRIGGCSDSTIVTAQFTISDNGVCAGTSVVLQGANIPYDLWTWTYAWDSTKNNNNPMPTTAISFSNNSDSFSSPFTNVRIDSAGVWDIILTVIHLDTLTGDSIPLTVYDTLEINILDCSISDQRNRITIVFDSTDWNVSNISIVNMPFVVSDSTIGYLISGSAFINGQNEVGVIMRVNSYGQTLWRKSVETSSGSVRLFDAASEITYDGNTDCYAFTGYLSEGGITSLLFLITNRLGDILYQKVVPFEQNSTPLSYATGIQVVQLSASFNNVFAISGFAGDGTDTLDAKVGFVIGIDPNIGVVWSEIFESPTSSSVSDYDIVENVTEIMADFGNGLQPAIVVGGNTNRITMSKSSGAFLSCLTIDSLYVITEQWRKNLETPTDNVGKIEMIAVDFDDSRLFSACFNQMSHGTFIFEINSSTGAIFSIGEILDFFGHEMIIENNNCVLTGGYSAANNSLAAFKIPLPTTTSNNWVANSSIFRSYDYTTLGDWGGIYNPKNYLIKPQNIVVSPNGGYAMVRETQLNILTPTTNGQSPIGLVFNKVDDFLVGACVQNRNIKLGGLSTVLNHPIITDSVQLTTPNNSDTVSCVLQNLACYHSSCSTPNFTSENLSKCPNDTILLANILSSIGDFSYQWSPSNGLSNDTILEPLCFSDTSIVYTLTVTDNTNQCVVLMATYNIYVIDTIFNTYHFDKCYNDSIVLTLSDSSLINDYYYQWLPSTSLINVSSLEPIYTSYVNRTFTLFATHKTSCQVKIYDYVIENTGIEEILIPCITDNIDYYYYSAPHHYIKLDTLLIRNGITNLNGTWKDPTVNSSYLLSNYLDSLNVLQIPNNSTTGIPMIDIFSELHYSYPVDSLCDSLVIVRLGLQATINNNPVNSTYQICDGETLTFVSTVTDTIWEHQWRFYDYVSLSFIDNFIDTTSFISYTFFYNTTPPLVHSYQVLHTVTNSECAGDVVFFTPSNSVIQNFYANVLPPAVSIIRSCNGQLRITNSLNTNIIQWYSLPHNLVGFGTTFTPSTSGQYYAIITHIGNQSCDIYSDTVNFALSNPTAEIVSFSDSICGQYFATVSVSNGVLPYTYLWSNTQTTAIATGLTAGVYQVTITDNCNNQATASITITEPTILSANTIQTMTACEGDSSNTATVSVSGGTSPYSYLWSNTQTDSIATSLISGLYTITITDEHNCSITDSVVIISNPLPSVVANASETFLCYGDSLLLTGSGAISYSWNYGVNNGSIFVPTLTRSYSVTGTDINGCQNIDSVTVVVASPLSLNIVFSAVYCNDSCIGVASINNIINGIAPYSYQWDDPINQTTVTATGLCEGIYHVTVTDSMGCQAIRTIPIYKDTMEFSASITQPCYEDEDGLGDIDLEVTGGSAPYTYDWSNSASSEDLIDLEPGVYIVTVTDDNGCQDSLLMEIVTANCVCSELAEETMTYFYWTDNLNLSASTIYALNANVIVAAGNNVVLTDIVVSMAPNIHITVESGATLSLDHCHFYACDSMWQGITVEPGGSLNIYNNSLIEDAVVAVEILNHTAITPILNINESVFNRNYFAISIGNYQETTTTYPFEIKNTIFTSRDLPTAGSWPNVNDLTTLLNNGDIGEHYEMGGYSMIGRKPPYDNNPICLGIHLEDVGVLNSGIYLGFELDGNLGTGAFNIFDNLSFGIFGLNSNVYATNNVFQFISNVPTTNFGGIGIGLGNSNIGTDFYSVEVEGDNRFYDCFRGIYIDGYTNINISETNMRSTQMPISSIPDEGENGILVTTSYLNSMNILENTITNIRNGIVFLADVLGASEQKIGPVNINENIIQATLDGNSGSPTNEYVLNGIIADNVLFSPGQIDTIQAPIIIYDNKLYQVHNGIHTQGWIFFEFASDVGWLNKVQTTNNYISLRQIGYPDSTPQPQFGIQHYANYEGIIYNNMIQGFGNTYNEWYGIMADDMKILRTPQAVCNTTTETGTGIIFHIPSNHYSFESNLMDNNGFGLVLDGSNIGTQGYSTYASGNLWTNFTGGNFKTYTQNTADPNNSILWIDTTDANQYPQGVFNWSDNYPTDAYDIGNGLSIVSSNANSTSCSAPQGRLIQNGISQNVLHTRSHNSMGNIDTLILISLIEQLITDSFNFAPFPDASRTMAAQRAYRMLELHQGLSNHSQILQNFYTTNHSSNIHKLTRIEEALSKNHLQQAEQLLNHFSPRNVVEVNAQSFFTAYLHIKQNRFSLQDSLELNRLVHGCTIRDGFAVPQSRALYRLKFKDFTNFFDNCGVNNNIAQRPEESIHNALNMGESRTFELYPNPNNGTMLLEYSLEKKEKGMAIISDITGKQIVIYKLDSEQNNLFIKESILVNGVYFVSFVVDDQIIGTKKLIIIK